MVATPYVWPTSFSQKPINMLMWSLARLNHTLTGIPIKPFCHVAPDLFVGGKISRAGWRRLETWGVSALVNMRVEFDDLSLGIRPDTYLWLPTIDGTPPTLEQLVEGVRVIQEAIAYGGKVFIHCAAGVGRAPTLAAAYLVSTGLTPEAAINHIRRRRPFISPSRWQRMRLQEFASLYPPPPAGAPALP